MKKTIFPLFIIFLLLFNSCKTTENVLVHSNATESKSTLTEFTVQVVNLEAVNLNTSETSWLPLQIQDKLNSNMQTYLGMKTVVDSKAESALKKLQAAGEDAGRDENTAIELGKITTAKYALFVKIRKVGENYAVSVDFTDLTTGEQMASCLSKEYSKAEYLYGSTGAADELTLALADKLKIRINDLNKNLLTSGSADFGLDDQLALAKQNEEQFNKMMADYDKELSKLMTSNDVNAIQNKKRIEAEKALLKEKQNAEKKRQEELNAQKQRLEADAKLEAERSIALKTQRDQMAKEAAAKAAEVRKLKMEKQGVLGQINILESKKKALTEIRQGVESRNQELFTQLEKDRADEEARIRNKSYGTVELDSSGNPTEVAMKRREKQVIESYKSLTEKFFADCDNVKNAAVGQDASLLAEIRVDQKSLTAQRTVSSMGEELKVSFGKYEGSENGWNAYLSLYSDGILLYTDSFIVGYEALSGKKAPNMAAELNDAVIEEYTNNVDMYSSLLTRGDPIIYFELDYNVNAESDDIPSGYKFNFSTIRVINTVSGKVVQTSKLNNVQSRTMTPEQDLRIVDGVAENERKLFSKIKVYFSNGLDLTSSIRREKIDSENEERLKLLNIKMIKIPSKPSIQILTTEVTQKMYKYIMGKKLSRRSIKGSKFKGENYPVENVSWYDAIYFCNKLSELCGYTPVYFINGTTNVKDCGYKPGEEHGSGPGVWLNTAANGFRLPTVAEWKEADYYGLYDTKDNVSEWCSDQDVGTYFRYYYDVGPFGRNKFSCELAYHKYPSLGFRIVRTVGK